jgi:peroxiredoxin
MSDRDRAARVAAPAAARPSGRARRLDGLVAGLLLLSGCGDLGGDLFPSGADHRPVVVPGTFGPAVGQTAPDFLLPAATGGEVSLYAGLASRRAQVLYFTMWCAVCDAHLSDLEAHGLPGRQDVGLYVIDYVSGSAAAARAAQVATGWDAPGLTVLADTDFAVADFYSASMSVVVVGADHVVRMNGEYDWATLQAVLSALP